jgi:14-3-3 protein epsilon
MTSLPREDLIFMARVAEQAERYDEMVEYARGFAKLNADLTTDERNILSVAYKNVVGSRRAAWRVLCSLEQKEEKKGNAANLQIIKDYKKVVEGEMSKLNSEILTLVDGTLLTAAKTEESKVFFYKMKGDYLRYMAEFQINEEKQKTGAKAAEAYTEAKKLAEEKMSSTNPIRLGLALNFSVFYYEIMQQPEKAIEMAKKSYDEALKDLESVPEDEYKDCTMILQLLKENLSLWSSDAEGAH